MNRIPLIDLDSALPRVETIKAIESACRDVGFMYVVNHGIASTTIAAIRNSVIDYFRQPLEKKLPDQITRENYRGYIPVGFFSPAVSGADADQYEGYKLHNEVAADSPLCAACDLYGPNKWPQNPPEFSSAVLDYWAACDNVAIDLLKMLAVPLGTDPDEFAALFADSLTNMTLLHYPEPVNGQTGFGIHPHKDTAALTILAGNDVAGLMARSRHSDNWIEVDPPDNALVVNIGDMIEVWSGGYFTSTPHKVENVTGRERFSFPYFSVPRFDVVVESLREPQPGFERTSVHVGDVSKEVWRTNWPDAVPHETGFDLGTIEN
ncbi:MAG: isopenicillin N synthase family dioxygenase [Woeseiaceae bacterium]